MNRVLLRTLAASMLVLGACAETPVNAPVPKPPGPYLSTGDVPVSTAAVRSVVVGGLEHPWSMAWLPDGTLLITERPGRLRVVRNDRLEPEPVSGVPEVLVFGQGGLMDLAVHPEFEQNRWLYFTYAVGTEEANATRLARARFDGARLTELEVLYTARPAKRGGAHFGSRLLWLPDGTLLMSIGDGGNPPLEHDGAPIREQAQNPSNALGKLVHFHDDGRPVVGPFTADAASLPGLYSLGHRNIQGLARCALSGRIYASEHGALGGDELNLILPGANYGWPRVTHSREYVGGHAISERTQAEGFEPPLLVWTHATAPSGLLVYSGDAFPQWRGDVFSGGLITQDVRRIDLDREGRILGQDALRIGARVRDVRQGPDGLIYVLTDESANARLLRFAPRPAG